MYKYVCIEHTNIFLRVKLVCECKNLHNKPKG